MKPRRLLPQIFLNPQTPVGQMMLQLGLNEDQINNTPNMASLAQKINAKAVQYEAGAASAHFSAAESTWQFVQDTGIGMIGDPDTVVEAVVTVASTIGAAFTKGATLAVPAALRAAKVAKAVKLAKKLEMGTDGGKKLRDTLKFVSTAPRRFLPSTLAEQLIVPAIGRVRTLKAAKKLNDEGAKAMGEFMSDKSIILRTISKDLFSGDIVPGTWKEGLVGNMIDGAVGEMAAYALMREEEYRWARFINGEAVDRRQFDATWSGYAQSGLIGAGFGAAIGSAFRLVGATLTGRTGLNDAVLQGQAAAEQGQSGMEATKLFFTGIRDSYQARNEMAASARVAEMFADVTGAKPMMMAKESARGYSLGALTTKLSCLRLMILLITPGRPALTSELLASKVDGRSIDELAVEIVKLGSDTKQAARRRAAVQALNGMDMEPIRALAQSIMERRINDAVETNSKISEVDSLATVKKMADEGDPEAKKLLGQLTEVAKMGNAAIVSKIVANNKGLTPGVLVDIADGMLRKQGRAPLSPEQRAELTKVLAEYESKSGEVTAQEEARLQEKLRTGLSQP